MQRTYPRKIRLAVNQNSIDLGQPGHHHYCPLAHALRKRGFTRITVDIELANFRIGRNGRRVFARLPQKAQQFVKDFDNGRTVTPCTLALTIQTK